MSLIVSENPEWIQVSDAGLHSVNGLYKCAPGWAHGKQDCTGPGSLSKSDSPPAGRRRADTDEDSDEEQYRFLAWNAAEYSKPYPFAFMCWENGDHILLFEPWNLPEPGGDTVKSRRFVIFADAYGVNGFEPYYQAFQVDEGAECKESSGNGGRGQRSDWVWMTGPAGISPPPRVKPFVWDGGWQP
eukprot:gnl/TRDRNA2_/TRDRNA2_125384_c1_seq2.p1 gnl/TRDRNA2_/TRDRNA2_125384_c1~~gnl/TRDRNA2_/TRDRNA2_125384_c1_seq2.p1  ORF type:complete len:186 (+),score=19.10 gnl/TRDRNA2_/TRDRNA2_125384_c1_seq2:270-827(+)